MMPNRLLIQCPASFQSLYNTRACDFELVNSQMYLKLPLHRSNYSPNKRYSGDSPSYLRSFDYPQVALKAYKQEFEIKLTDERSPLYYLIQKIARNSYPTLQTHTPVTVIDYVLPEAEDVEAAFFAGTEPFTIRTGLLTGIKAGGGTVSDGARSWIGGGSSFKFEELAMRYE
jgi:hypothetical protein